MRILLRPLSWLYGAGVGLRNLLFDAGWLPSESFPVPVITVGNLIAGGSGKSPHVLMLLALLRTNYRVAVLSRGYGRSTTGFRLVSTTDTPEIAGDEPLQYLHYYPETVVAVCEDRRKGIRNLLAIENPPQLILLDDAYQHRYVKAGLNILLTEYSRPFTQDHLLPEGMLRETKSGASRADYILITKSPFPLPASAALLKSEIAAYSKAPVAFTYMRYREPIPLNPDLSPLALNSSSRIFLVTGIARPEPLLEFLQSKVAVVEHLRFADHHAFSNKDIELIKSGFIRFQQNQPGAVLLTTRKDAMRFVETRIAGLVRDTPFYVIDIEAVLAEENTNFVNLILKYAQSNS
jgi:tetraacyldisaccharide 4'-kinase